LLCVAGLLALACQKARYTSGEGVHCSDSEDDDPQYSCIRSYDLVCITTHKTQVRSPTTNVQIGEEAVYLCRLACSPGDLCPQGDVCCPGKIYGRTYGKTHACVPEDLCADYVPPKRDAGSRAADGGAPDGAAADGRPADVPGADAGTTSDGPDAGSGSTP
jgi:hypothetical protein